MKINAIKKVKGLYEVTFDNEVVGYHEEVIIKYGLLRSNIEMSKEEYENSLIDNRYFLCRDKAVKYLVNIKFVNQVKEHLLKSEELFIVKRVIEDLVENKILDDYNTSTIYTLSKYNKGYGSKELYNRLKKQKVDTNIIEKVLLECREDELFGIDKYTLKLINTIKSLNKKDLNKKIEQRLIAHGYSFSDIRNTMNKNNTLIETNEYNENILEKYFEKAIKKYIDIDNNYTKEQKIISFLLYKGFEFDEIKGKVDLWKKGDN